MKAWIARLAHSRHNARRAVFMVVALACALVIMATGLFKSHALAAGPAQSAVNTPTNAPYEIRATIITRASYKGLMLKVPGTGFWGMGGTSYRLEDKHLVKQEALQNKFNRYDVLVPVEDKASTKHQKGAEVSYRLENTNTELSNITKATVQYDEKKNTLFSHVNIRESFDISQRVRFVDPQQQTIVARNNVPDFPILFNGKELLLRVRLHKSGEINRVVAPVTVDETGHYEKVFTPSATAKGKIVTLNGTPYVVSDVKKTADKIIEVHVKKLEIEKKTIRVALKRPFALGAWETKWTVSSGVDKKDVTAIAAAGRSDIAFSVELSVPKDQPQISVQSKVGWGSPACWHGATVLKDGSFDAATSTYTATIARDIALHIVPLTPGLLGKDLQTWKSLANLSLSLKDEAGNPVDVPVRFKENAYHLEGVLPGTYTLTLASDDAETRRTYNLSGTYSILLKEDGTLMISHLGDAKRTLYYASGYTQNPFTSVDKLTLAGTKYPFYLGIPHNPAIEKTVRLHNADAHAATAPFSKSIYAAVGDTVEYDVKITLPTDYNLVWQFGKTYLAGLQKGLQLEDVLDKRLELDSASLQVLDEWGQLLDGFTSSYDAATHKITVMDTRDALMQKVVFNKPFELREQEQIVHLRFRAKVLSFGDAPAGGAGGAAGNTGGTAGNTADATPATPIPNVIGDSKTSVKPYTSIDVTKIWKDHTGAAADVAKLPAQTEVELFANGVATGKKLTLSAQNSWKGSFERLPQKDAADKIIAYSVKEVGEADGKITFADATWQVTYAVDKSGVTITNTLPVPPTPPTPPAPPTPPTPPAPPTPPTPPTPPVVPPTPPQPGEPPVPVPPVPPTPPVPSVPPVPPIPPAAPSTPPTSAQPQPKRSAVPKTSDATLMSTPQMATLFISAATMLLLGVQWRSRSRKR